MMKKLLGAALLVGVAAFGVTMALRSHPDSMTDSDMSAVAPGSDAAAGSQPASMAEPANKRRPAGADRVAGTDRTADRSLMASRSESPSVERVVLTDDVAGVVKPLLNRGTNLSMAADGFTSRQDFVAAAYAAKNLDIPFVVLKDRIVTRHESLATAIAQIKPQANASLEANRAAAEARADLGK